MDAGTAEGDLLAEIEGDEETHPDEFKDFDSESPKLEKTTEEVSTSTNVTLTHPDEFKDFQSPSTTDDVVDEIDCLSIDGDDGNRVVRSTSEVADDINRSPNHLQHESFVSVASSASSLRPRKVQPYSGLFRKKPEAAPMVVEAEPVLPMPEAEAVLNANDSVDYSTNEPENAAEMDVESTVLTSANDDHSNTKTSNRRRRRTPKEEHPSKGRNSVRSMTSGCGGFFHIGVISNFNEARRIGSYDDNGFKKTATNTISELEANMWSACRKLFPTRPHIQVDEWIWGNRDNSRKKKFKGVKSSAEVFRKHLAKVFKKLEESFEGKLAIFLIVSQVGSTNNGDEGSVRLVHTNALIVRCKGDAYTFFVFDPFMPSADKNAFSPIRFVVDLCRETWRQKDDRKLNVIFGKQDGSSDCFHRGIDFIARVVENNVNMATVPTMPHNFSAKHIGRVIVPQEFYGGI